MNPRRKKKCQDQYVRYRCVQIKCAFTLCLLYKGVGCFWVYLKGSSQKSNQQVLCDDVMAFSGRHFT